MKFSFFTSSLSFIITCEAYQKMHSIPYKSPKLQLNLNEDIDKPIFVEFITTRKYDNNEITSQREQARIIAYETLYQETKEDKVSIVLDSPIVKALQVCLNPTTLLLAIYLSSIGWSNVLWLQKILKIFGKGSLVSKDGQPVIPVQDLPFQIFECEKCQLEMRPAKGRAEAIFGRPRFRCPRCGSKASAYFNVDDLSDPRAVTRLERLEKEKSDRDNEVDLNDDVEE